MPTRVAMAVWSSLVVAASLAGASVALGGDSDASQEELYQYLVSGMKNHRQQLVRGVFYAHGVRVFESSSRGRHEGDVSFFCAFDHAGDRVRFDRQEPAPNPAPSRSATGEWYGTSSVTSKFIRTPESSAHQTTGGPNIHISNAVSIHGPDYVPMRQEACPLDVRSFGLYYWPGFCRGTDFETLHDGLVKFPPDEIVDEGTGLYRVVWNFKTHRRTLWIDENKGCSPVRLWAQDKSTVAGQTYDEDPRITNDVTYQTVAGVWVPSTFHFRARTNEFERPRPGIDKFEPGVGQRPTKTGHVATAYLLTMDWQSVNEPVPDKYFSHEDFQLADGTFVVERRSGESVILEEVGRDQPDFGLEDAGTPAEWSAGRIMIVVGNVLLVCALVFFLLFRRRRSSH